MNHRYEENTEKDREKKTYALSTTCGVKDISRRDAEKKRERKREKRRINLTRRRKGAKKEY
jgi:hypothetical protein